MKIYRKSSFLLVVVLASASLMACSKSVGLHLSRAGEVQFSSPPQAMFAMVLSPRRQARVFSVSHVHGMYITQGDIVIDTDSRRAAATGSTVRPQLKQNLSTADVESLTHSIAGLQSVDVRRQASAVERSLRTFGYHLPDNSQGKSSLSPRSATGTAAQGYYLAAIDGRWRGPIPYCVDPGVPSKSDVEEAVTRWHLLAGLPFIEDPAEQCAQYAKSGAVPGMIWFIHGDGCDSFVGRVPDVANTIHLNDNCADVGGIMHEIGHALGLFHEQARPDRDGYVTIVKSNIIPKYVDQFDADPSQPGVAYGAYDCHSIMHYPTWAFAIDIQQPTIIPRLKEHPDCTDLGQRNGPSTEDISEVKSMYPIPSSSP